MRIGIRDIRARIGQPLQSVAYMSGVMTLTDQLRRRRGATILMYHSVAEDDTRRFIDPRNHVSSEVFEQHMAFIAANRRVISLSDLLASIRCGRMTESDSVVVTFDDGYLDNLTNAAPLLRRYGLPATVFLPTRYIDCGRPQWIDEAYSAFKFRTRDELCCGESSNERYKLDDADQHMIAYTRVCNDLLASSYDDRAPLLESLWNQLEPSEETPRLTMGWDDVNELLSEFECIEIGAHTGGHIDLTSVSEGEVHAELVFSADRIEEQTGQRARHFAYPYGRSSDRLAQLVAAAGFESACLGDRGETVPTSRVDPFALPRVEAPSTMERFDLLTTTANSGLWRRLGR